MRFTLKIEDEFLDVLDSLAELVLDQPVCSAEEALEVAIFTHLQFQRTRSSQNSVPL
jgi:predicted transcriptional regulator